MTDIVLDKITSGYNLSKINKNFEKVEDVINDEVLHLEGGNNVMKQDLDMNGHALLNLATNPNEPGSMLTVEQADARYVNVKGDTLEGPLNAGGQAITNLREPVGDSEPARKIDVDEEEDARIDADQNLQAQLTGTTPLEASAFSEISWHDQVIQNSVTIPVNKNAWSFGPQMTIAFGQEVQVSEGSSWTIADGDEYEGPIDYAGFVKTNDLSASSGSNLVGYNGGTLTKRLSNQVLLSDYAGYTGNGVADDTAYIQAALNSGAKVIIGVGKCRVTSTLSWPMGVRLVGDASVGFELNFDLAAGSDGVVVSDPTAGFKFITGMENVTVTTNSRTRYMFTTPSSANAFNRQCFFVFKKFTSCDSDKSKTVCTNYWDRVLNLGDSKGVSIEEVQMFGGHSPTNTSASANSTGIYISSTSGAIGVNIRNGSMTSFTKAIDFSNGVEGYTVSDMELVSCWYGIDHTNTAGEPGGFINNLHINTNYRGIRFYNRVEFNVSNISVYRSSGFTDHSLGWAAIELDTCSFKGNISDVNIVPSNSTNGVNCAVKATNCATNSIQISKVVTSTKLTNFAILDSVSGMHFNDVYARGHDVFCTIASTVFTSANLHFENIDLTTTDANLLTTTGTVDLSTVSFRRTPRGSSNQPASLSLTASGDFTINPKAGFTGISISSASSITANIILSSVGATGGDTVRLKFINSSTTGHTINFCNKASANVLNIIRSGNSNRYILEYTYNGTNWTCNFIHLDLDATLRT